MVLLGIGREEALALLGKSGGHISALMADRTEINRGAD
jgi:hypothetical protein